MAYLGSVAHGKRDVAQKVETTKKVYGLILNSFYWFQTRLNAVQFAKEFW